MLPLYHVFVHSGVFSRDDCEPVIDITGVAIRNPLVGSLKKQNPPCSALVRQHHASLAKGRWAAHRRLGGIVQ